MPLDILNSIDGKWAGLDNAGRLVARDYADAAGDAKVISKKLYSNVAASTAVTNTTTETAFDQKYTLPANSLQVGSVLRIRAQGIATATNSTDTLNAKLYIGGTTGQLIAQTGALDVANNDLFTFDFELIVRTIGATGTIVGAGYTFVGTPGTANLRAAYLASSTLDTTANKDIVVSATWSVANAGNSCRLDVLHVDLM